MTDQGKAINPVEMPAAKSETAKLEGSEAGKIVDATQTDLFYSCVDQPKDKAENAKQDISAISLESQSKEQQDATAGKWTPQLILN